MQGIHWAGVVGREKDGCTSFVALPDYTPVSAMGSTAIAAQVADPVIDLLKSIA
jgi:hypothetical protein